jgi:putative DNA-invertase from lambdoid prophage Rac
MRRAFGYVRVSSAAQAEKGDSLQVQQDLIKAICAVEGLTLIHTFIEEGVSGSKPLASRPQGQLLIDTVQSGDVVICLRLDRAFRNTTDALETLNKFKAAGVSLYLKDVGGMVSGDSVSELIFSLMSSVASFERSRTRERIVEVKAELKLRNRHLGGCAQFGTVITVGADGKKYLAPDDAVIADVKRLVASGNSSRGIAGYFAQQGIKVSHHSVNALMNRLTA